MYNEEFTKYLLNLENIDIEKSWRENFNELDPFINYIRFDFIPISWNQISRYC